MLLKQAGYRKYYDNPEEAIQNGKSRKAIGYTFGEVYHGKQQRIMIVFEKEKTPYVAYPTAPGLDVRKATTKEVESVREWVNLVPR